jgi:hypothetical protein
MAELVKQRIYIDTSVIGGYFDIEFSEVTQILFEKFRSGEWTLVYSETTEQELIDAPEKVRALLKEIPVKNLEFISLTKEAAELADTYILENVVGKTSRADCLHIAIATINNVDILVSWNFKHIVNINRIRGYNGVNIMLGYPTVEIRSPAEILSYE